MSAGNRRKVRFVVETLEGRNMMSTLAGPVPGCPAGPNPEPLTLVAEVAAFSSNTVANELNPQPLPPHDPTEMMNFATVADELNPQPLPP